MTEIIKNKKKQFFKIHIKSSTKYKKKLSTKYKKKLSKKIKRKSSKKIKRNSKRKSTKKSKKLSKKSSKKIRKQYRDKIFIKSIGIKRIKQKKQKYIKNINQNDLINWDKKWETEPKTNLKKEWKIYKKDGCNACTKAIELFKKNNIKYLEYKKNNQEEYLNKITNNYEYVPIIINPNGTFFGGYEELEKYINRFKKL
jgi:glutaredoxin